MSTRLRLARPLLAVGLVSVASGVAAAAALWLAGSLGMFGALTGPVSGGGWTDRSRAWMTTRGFFSTEFDGNRQPYTWTGGGIRIVVPHLDRSQTHRLTLTVASGRAVEGALPTLTPTIDGVVGEAVPIPNEFITVPIVIPPSTASRAVVTMQVAPTFDPGPHDERMLGVLVRGVTFTSDSGTFRPTWAVCAWLGLAVAATVAGVWLTGLSGLLGSALAAGIAVAFVWLLTLDGAFLGPYVDWLVQIGGVACGVGVVTRVLTALVAAERVKPSWAMAVGLILAGTIVKLAFFTHPQITIGDGYFQMHRAQMVRGGQYFFTSITPRPFFEFPYAIGLYVTAMPFWSWFPREFDQVWLLRAVSLAADALAGLALFAVVRRAWASDTAALYFAGLWPFARAPFEALCNSNLTNAFAQSVFGIAVAGLAWAAMGGGGALIVGVLSVGVLAAAFLSHFSTLSVGVPLVGLIASALVVGGRPTVRWKGVWIGLVCVAAVGVSYAAYYRHFHHVYQQTVERVMSHETVETPGSSIAASPMVKLQRWATGGSDDYGLPGVPLAAATILGFVWIVRQRMREPWTLILAAWLATWLGFTALGILSSVQMRVNLAGAPMFVCLGAYALAGLSASSSPARRVAAAALAVVIAFDGARLWWMCLGH